MKGEKMTFDVARRGRGAWGTVLRTARAPNSATKTALARCISGIVLSGTRFAVNRRDGHFLTDLVQLTVM